jgi:hypothetical protein
MAARFRDAEIAELPAEPKPLPSDYQNRLKFRDKRGHEEWEIHKNNG